MNPIHEKTIILGVTGSIAGYKAAELTASLSHAGANVDVILTESAARFVSPLTFQSLTARKAYVDADLWNGEGLSAHLNLGQRANLMLIAPASANTIAKLAHGIGDNLLTATALTATCPLMIVPAMESSMYNHPATQSNLEILQQRGAILLGPTSGRSSTGRMGQGRFVEPQEITARVRYLLSRGGPLSGRKVAVTAGGTLEPVDALRAIANRSSGPLGYALAQAALDAGADVTLISANVSHLPPAGAHVIHVQTGQELLEAVQAECDRVDALLLAASVSNAIPGKFGGLKSKKENGVDTIRLIAIPDILSRVVERKADTGLPRRIIGFSSADKKQLADSQARLEAHEMDLLVVQDPPPFHNGQAETGNPAIVWSAGGQQQVMQAVSTDELADTLIAQLIQML